jgi:hypothetical protein
MVHIVTNVADEYPTEDRPSIVVSDLLEVIDDSVDFSYHLGPLSEGNMGIALTLQYHDAESKGELHSVILPDMPAWLVDMIEQGDSVKILDSARQVTIELASQVRELDYA